MNRTKRTIGFVGVLAAASGLLAIIRPSLVASLSVPWTGIVALGVVAGVQGLYVLHRRRNQAIEQATPSDPERGVDVERPGAAFDREIGKLPAIVRPSDTEGSLDRIRARLREVATGAIRIREGISQEAARERVATGEWTDDPVAAWFLGEEVEPPPRGRRIRIRFARTPTPRVFARRTANALRRYWREP